MIATLDRLLFNAITRRWEDGRIGAYCTALGTRNEAITPVVLESLQTIDTKAGGLLTHVSVMIAGLGLIAPMVASNDVELGVIIFEIAVYLLIAIGCLRALSVFRSERLAPATAAEAVSREIILRRELYALCNQASIVFTIFVFISLPVLYFWTPGKLS